MVARNSRLLLWAAVWALGAVALALVALSSLPDPLAIHWGPDGSPDGSAPLWALPATGFLVAVLGLVLAPIFSVGSEPSMEAFAVTGMSGALAVALVGVASYANWGADSWTEAREIGVLAIVALFGLPLLGIASGIVLGKHWYPVKLVERSDVSRDVIEVESGERVSWVGRARVKGVPLGMFAVAIALIFFLPEFPLWAFVLVVGVGMVFSQVEAQVTNDGLRVRLGGVPVRRISLDSISSARMIDAEPVEFGGWGWRVVGGKTAIMLRAGEALAVTLRNGRQFVISVDDAATGAGLINGLVELDESRG